MAEGSRARVEVELDPVEGLAFKLERNIAPEATLVIKNLSSESRIAFKVKTTQPRRYLVRPNQGMINVNDSANITVILQARDCEDLLAADPRDREQGHDKFLVQSVPVDEAFYNAVSAKAIKEQSEDLAHMWNEAQANKKDLVNKKLKCVFTVDNAEDAESGAASSSAKADALKGPTVSNPDSRPQEYASNISESAALQKKYDELVAFTVQLTAQRDQLMNDLDKAKKAAAAAKAAGLRQRNLGADQASAHDSSPSKKQVNTSATQGLSLFHILVAAVLFFFVGRYFK